MESQIEQPAGGEGTEPSRPTPNVSTASSALISRTVDYIANLAPRLLFDAEETSEALVEALTSKSGHKAISRFLADSKVSAIYLESPIVPGESSLLRKWLVQTDGVSSPISHGVAFIKRANVSTLEEGLPVGTQLQVMTLGPGSWAAQQEQGGAGGGTEAAVQAVLSLLQQYTRHAFAPLIKGFTQEATRAAEGYDVSSPGGTASGKAGASGVTASLGAVAAGPSSAPTTTATATTSSSGLLSLQKKLTELELALAQCQKSMEIPVVELMVHPDLAQAAALVGSTSSSSNSSSSTPRIDLDALGLAHRVRDDAFLNSVQSVVNGWVKDVQRVTRLTQTPFPDTVLEEVNFWRSLDEALRRVELQLSTPGVLVTVALLRQARRLIALAALESNTGLDNATKVVSDVLGFVRDLPIHSLLSASTLDQLATALSAFFQHLLKLKNSKHYEIERAGKLVEALSRAFAQQIKAVLRQHVSVMVQSYEDFMATRRELDALFATWKAGSLRFEDMFRDTWKKRRAQGTGGATSSSQALKSWQSNLEHTRLQQRLEDITAFRQQHQRFCQVVEEVLSDEDGEALRDLEGAYARFLGIDVLDTSNEGRQAWALAREAYEQRIDRLEERVIRILQDKLSGTSSAEEMFRVFSKFNPLFFRPRIRAAISEFQADLIKSVREAVHRLQAKFTDRYEQSEARVTAALRDMPPVAGKILWARQIERQLRLLMQRMEDVLGAGWEKHVEGKQLKGVCDELLRNLDTDAFFKKWIRDVEEELNSLSVSKKEKLRMHLLLVGRDRYGDPCLQVNFDEHSVMLFKEVRNLVWLGFRVPAAIIHLSDESSKRYPFAMALQATLRTYRQTRQTITPDKEALLIAHLKAVREKVGDAIVARGKHRVKWDSPDVSAWVTELSERVFTLQEKTEQLCVLLSQVEGLYESIKDCPFEPLALLAIIQSLQKVVDDMNLAGYVHVDRYVAQLDARLEAAFSKRLLAVLSSWELALSVEEQQTGRRATTPRKAAGGPVCAIQLEPQVHEVVIHNQTLFLSPPLEHARRQWISTLHHYLGVVCNLPRLKASRFDVFGSREEGTFSDLARKLPPDSLARAYQAIETLLDKASVYVDKWLQYQALWDMNAQAVVDALGSDLHKWVALLTNMKAARGLIEHSATQQTFGQLVVGYTQVQGKVNLKYDAWQKDLQARFGAILADAIRETHTQLTGARSRLEGVMLDGGSRDVIEGVSLIQEMRRQAPQLAHSVAAFEHGERLLKRQRYPFPHDWPQVENVMGALDAFHQVLQRRADAMEKHIPALRLKVRAEDKALSTRLAELAGQWNANKPLHGDQSPRQALEVLSSVEAQASRERADYDRLGAARLSLGVEGSDDAVLRGLEEELGDLRAVWTAVLPLHDALQVLRETGWSSVVSRKVRAALEEVMEQLRQLPNRIRQYEAYVALQSKVRAYQAAQPIIAELKTDALKERHWRAVLKRLNVRVGSLADLTLGALWDTDLLAQRAAIQEVLVTAQGEMALEVFLRQVREHWVGCELEMATYRSRTRLIKGWEVLFAKLEEHLSALATMKLSPYFRAVQEFQEEAGVWDDRLSRVKAILDCWISVQRRWVYLEGIFFGSADIKAQLPSEYARFKSIDTEFVNLMRKVAHKPGVLEVLSIENLLRQLERQEGMMSKIQKALGEYLRRQRAAFSRFYFVGDEDLLEVIGNASEPSKVVQHLGKMFASLSSVVLEPQPPNGGDAQWALAAMLSREGEQVALQSPVRVSASLAVRDWLQCLEEQMRCTLASELQVAVDGKDRDFAEWVQHYPTQVVILAVQIWWSSGVEASLSSSSLPAGPQRLQAPLDGLSARLLTSVQRVLTDANTQVRKKFEQLITEFVHERDVVRDLAHKQVSSPSDFQWLSHLRFYWTPGEVDVFRKLGIRMANAHFYYGFEYLGIGERLVQTPLTDRCYLTLTQALHFGMGGNPFGPAGTGKTESVKALGAQLGRFVLVFNCDENFDYSAMGRLFAGLCQVGAWGCFDEFNRLEERILSAVSQQILSIQRGLAHRLTQIELLGEATTLHPNVGIFVTLNPGYAGRSNLPDNLKQLFRAVAMTTPDRGMIARVMLFSQGMECAEELAGKIVLLFSLCEEQLSPQPHYDFGLRALKTVLVGAGSLKRDVMSRHPEAALSTAERDVLILSTCSTVVPKLVAQDLPIFRALLQGVFPGCDLSEVDEEVLRTRIAAICQDKHMLPEPQWTAKVLQLKQVLSLRHGVMLVGPPCCGKSSAWRTLLAALEADGSKGEAYVIDPKAMSKDLLYGTLDGTTLEWTDGVFTATLRQVLTNVRGERDRVHWIVFDGDVDPEWAENLNSVLDDNRLLTLPSGERLQIPDNVRILMEVDSLRFATLATVSRCGMVWFSHDTVTDAMLLHHYLGRLRHEPALLLESGLSGEGAGLGGRREVSPVQHSFVDAIAHMLLGGAGEGTLVATALKASLGDQGAHVMEAERGRLLDTFFALLARGAALAVDYDDNHPDFQMSADHLERFAHKWVLFSSLWGFGSSLPNERREALGRLLSAHSTVALPPGASLIDLQPRVEDGEWVEWSAQVPRLDMETHRVTASDVVVPTTDTLRHVEVLRAWLASHRPLILCGPPGSGKTMTLTSTLQSMPNLVLASLNFSSSTTPELILKTFAQYCEYVRTSRGTVLQPAQSFGVDKWLVIFCDEINLPEVDRYGTQRVISLLRQLTEAGGFWRSDCTWVSLHRIQFVGACNPPTDAGRVPLSLRFLRHAPVLLVDFPARSSLGQIYRSFNAALLKLHPSLLGYVDPLTDAMIDFYQHNQARFTPDQRPQYVYSPRELSRWVRGVFEAVSPLDSLSPQALVRVWAHEALRLFHDRLTQDDEREWCNNTLDQVAATHFPSAGEDALARPILFSKWLSKHPRSVNREELRTFVAARLRVFYEEELDVPLVIFDQVLEHVLRIDAVLRQPMGHLLLVGESGVGKTVLARFVSWMNGLSVFRVKASSQYTLERFDEDLRCVMKRSGLAGERICFIFDESNALSSAFLEKMNALLASGEVPGLFEGDEYAALLAGCREAATRAGSMADSEEELFRRFTRQVQRNLHVVFTMNPAGADFDNRCTTSPALFNRCVVDWFGTWSPLALAQVAYEFTLTVDTGAVSYRYPGGGDDLLEVLGSGLYQVGSDSGPSLHQALVAALVHAHHAAKDVTHKLAKRATRRHYISPRDFLDLIRSFVSVVGEKRAQLEEQQLHINIGLDKLAATQTSVEALQRELAAKKDELRDKNTLANAKLQQMVSDQNEAERRRVEADAVGVELDKQNAVIATRRDEAQRDLANAEPALLAAQQSVKSIKKQQLDEVRALARPPNPVKLTLEAVLILLGETTKDWNEIRKLIRKDDFISTVVNFDPESISGKQVKEISDNYLKLDEFQYENVDRASKACGPLNKWVVSQLHYSTILKKVQPLRDEVTALQAQSDTLQQQKDHIITQMATLEASIARYKLEYAEAIREIEAIKSEMENVGSKVRRAEGLLVSLTSEKDRWLATSASFQEQLSSLLGDALLSASFLTYAGALDHRSRAHLLDEWADTLTRLGVSFRADLCPAAYLCRPAQLLEWTSMGLPSDQLCTENATILQRFNRFPLVIDPSGQATTFLLNKYAGRKMQRTSFLDAAFLKTLASAIRFGTPLLVQDVEAVDPILNPVLNREFQRTGGRTILRLGNEDIDYSPQFVLFMVTRNPTAAFTPDLCSRVTLVNFTVTPASLQAQALGMILRSERPDVERRRSEVLRLQGEQNVKLRELEEGLLNQLSATQGNILDDDRVIRTLEELKAEAAEVNRDVASTAEVMAELKAISDTYEPLALAVSQVYFTLERLGESHFLYQFPIQYLLGILGWVLTQQPPPSSVPGPGGKDRVGVLLRAIVREVARRVSKGLLQEDQLAFAMRLAHITLAGEGRGEASDVEMSFLFRGPPLLAAPRSVAQDVSGAIPGRVLDEGQCRELQGLMSLPALAPLASAGLSSPDWAVFMDSPVAETLVPDFQVLATGLGSAVGAVSVRSLCREQRGLYEVLLVRALRKDRLLAAMEGYVTLVLGQDFPYRGVVELQEVVEVQACASCPVLLCSEPGHDASKAVDDLADGLRVHLSSVAMGSEEGFESAERLISSASSQGTWVLLRNIHLCPAWLEVLEKRLHNLTPDPRFRLFLTAEVNPRLPTSLLRLCDVMVVEAPRGLKANVLRLFTAIPPTRLQASPVEKVRLFFLLSWFHAVVTERLRYVPLGWSHKYEFSQADAQSAFDVIEEWVNKVANGRAHVSPDAIPWEAIRTMLSHSIYGGRVDNSFDQRLLDSFLQQLLTPQCFDVDFPLALDADGKAAVVMPDCVDRQGYMSWLETLPNSNPTTWLGLGPSVEAHILANTATRVLAKVMALQDMLGAVDEPEAGHSSQAGYPPVTPGTGRLGPKLKALLGTVESWSQLLDKTLAEGSGLALPAGVDNTTILQRCMMREVDMGRSLGAKVRVHLRSAVDFMRGDAKPTKAVKVVLEYLAVDAVPSDWTDSFKASNRLGAAAWVVDLSKRIKHGQDVLRLALEQPNVKPQVWLGGLFSPEAFITATRQIIAQRLKCSLENLTLRFSVHEGSEGSASDATSFTITGLALEGATWERGSLQLMNTIRSTLPSALLSWVKGGVGTEKSELSSIQVPIYLNESRTTLISKVDVARPKSVPDHVWSQRGVAFVCWSTSI